MECWDYLHFFCGIGVEVVFIIPSSPTFYVSSNLWLFSFHGFYLFSYEKKNLMKSKVKLDTMSALPSFTGLPSLYLTRNRLSEVVGVSFLTVPNAKERLEFRASDKRCCIILLGHQIYVNHQIRPFPSGS